MHLAIIVNSEDPCLVIFAPSCVPVISVVLAAAEEVLLFDVRNCSNTVYSSQLVQSHIPAKLGIFLLKLHDAACPAVFARHVERIILEGHCEDSLWFVRPVEVVILKIFRQVFELVMVCDSRELVGLVRHFLGELDQL